MTSQTLEQFINKVGNYGISRNNKFEIVLPTSLDSSFNYTSSKLTSDNKLASIYAESVDIPGKLINTVATRIAGKTYERPMEFLYDGPLVITFLVDTRHQINKYFNTWLSLVYPNGRNTSFNPALPDSYRHSLMVKVVDNLLVEAELSPTGMQNPVTSFLDGFKTEGKTSPKKADTREAVVGEYIFHNIYPKSISGSHLTNAGKDFQRLKVTFIFDYYNVKYPESTPNASVAPPLTKGTGTGILGSLNGIANSAGKTLGGNVSSVMNIGGSINKILGL